jgi:hypothetical protein
MIARIAAPMAFMESALNLDLLPLDEREINTRMFINHASSLACSRRWRRNQVEKRMMH